MTNTTIAFTSTDPDVRQCHAVLVKLFADLQPRFFDVRFWDGTVWSCQPEPSSFSLVLHHAGTLRRMLWPPVPLSFSSAYIYDDFDIEGDMFGFQRLCRYLEGLSSSRSTMQRIQLGWSIWRLPRFEKTRQGRGKAELSGQVHSRERDRQAIGYHYDLSNPFFEKILDPYMQYTSGIFADSNVDLAKAQEHKLDLICRKLRLRAGERLLDIGCGWGGLMMYAARQYGVQTVGVTLSRFQAEWAQAKIKAAGLEERCTVRLMDYRDLTEFDSFDKITTIEVAEHFGAEQFATYMTQCVRLLRPGGTSLMQQITLTGKENMPPPAKDFAQHFVFPDGELVPVSFTLKHAELAGFEVRDVESFREHYSLTLRHWLQRLENNREACTADTDEATYRIFRLYLAGAVHGFEANIYNLHQILLVKPANTDSGLPLSRLDWYA